MGLIAALKEQQSVSGAFKSHVWLTDRPLLDQNGFTTALVLRELHGVDNPAIDEVRRRALGYLLRCESWSRPYSFAFWPRDDYPFWMRSQRLYEDADDTAVGALELVRYGMRPPQCLTAVAERHLRQYRVEDEAYLTQPWQRPGVFFTWLHRFYHDNPIDCCVNANVVALLAYAGLQALPGYVAACAMINQAVDWAGGDPAALAQATPYYPHPIELYYAVRHAVAMGAHEIQAALTALEQSAWVAAILAARPNPEQPVCANAAGRIYWTCEILQLVRRRDAISNLP